MFTLTLVTPEKKLMVGEEIEEIFVQAHRGELNILPGHAPLMTTLRPGVLKYRLRGESKLQYVALSWGYCQVNPLGVNILAETAERPEELDKARAEKTLKEAQQRSLTETMDTAALEKNQARIARAQARLDVSKQAGPQA